MSIIRTETPHKAQNGAEAEEVLRSVANLRRELQYALLHLDSGNFTENGLRSLATEVARIIGEGRQ